MAVASSIPDRKSPTGGGANGNGFLLPDGSRITVVSIVLLVVAVAVPPGGVE